MQTLTHLKQLEAESLHILREVVAEFERPVMLYSVGKDSSVMLRLAQKAFYPCRLPFPLLHINTGYKFKEMYAFRDRVAKAMNAELIVYKHPEAGRANPFKLGTQKCCGLLKTQALLNALREHRFEAAFGGARREEEKSRAKERVYSFRDSFGQWDSRNQRPELWNIYNGRINKGESIRVFPLSNWTELDIWQYILEEDIAVVPMYFAREREVIVREDQLIPLEGPIPLRPGEIPQKVLCRFRSLGCYRCTGAIRSAATTVAEIIEGYPQATPGLRLGHEYCRFSGHLAWQATMASGVGSRRARSRQCYLCSLESSVFIWGRTGKQSGRLITSRAGGWPPRRILNCGLLLRARRRSKGIWLRAIRFSLRLRNRQHGRECAILWRGTKGIVRFVSRSGPIIRDTPGKKVPCFQRLSEQHR